MILFKSGHQRLRERQEVAGSASLPVGRRRTAENHENVLQCGLEKWLTFRILWDLMRNWSGFYGSWWCSGDLITCFFCTLKHDVFLVEPTFEDLQKVELHLATSEVAISACEKGGAWECALCLAEKMQILQLKLDVCTYSALITACETWRQMDRGGQICRKICGHVSVGYGAGRLWFS